MLRILTSDAKSCNNPAPTARRKAISTQNAATTPAAHSLPKSYENPHQLNYYHDHDQHCHHSASPASAVAPSSTSPSRERAIRRQKRISLTFGGPGSVSGSGSGSSNSSSTPTSGTSPLSPLFEFLTHSPLPMKSSLPPVPQSPPPPPPQHPFDLHPPSPATADGSSAPPVTRRRSSSQHQYPLANLQEASRHQDQLSLTPTTPLSPNSPLESGTFGIQPVMLPQLDLTNVQRCSTPLTSNDISAALNLDSEREEQDLQQPLQQPLNWSPTSGQRARFTFGFNDTMLQGALETIPPPSPTRYDNDNDNINHDHNNDIIRDNKAQCPLFDKSSNTEGASNHIVIRSTDNRYHSDMHLPPLPLSSTVRSPRIQSTPSKHPSVMLATSSVPPTPAATSSFFFSPRRLSWKRQSFTAPHSFTNAVMSEFAHNSSGASGASSTGSDSTPGAGLPHVIPVRSSSRSNSLGSEVSRARYHFSQQQPSQQSMQRRPTMDQQGLGVVTTLIETDESPDSSLRTDRVSGKKQRTTRPHGSLRRQRFSFLTSMLMSSVSPSTTLPTTVDHATRTESVTEHRPVPPVPAPAPVPVRRSRSQRITPPTNMTKPTTAATTTEATATATNTAALLNDNRRPPPAPVPAPAPYAPSNRAPSVSVRPLENSAGFLNSAPIPSKSRRGTGSSINTGISESRTGSFTRSTSLSKYSLQLFSQAQIQTQLQHQGQEQQQSQGLIQGPPSAYIYNTSPHHHHHHHEQQQQQQQQQQQHLHPLPQDPRQQKNQAQIRDPPEQYHQYQQDHMLQRSSRSSPVSAAPSETSNTSMGPGNNGGGWPLLASQSFVMVAATLPSSERQTSPSSSSSSSGGNHEQASRDPLSTLSEDGSSMYLTKTTEQPGLGHGHGKDKRGSNVSRKGSWFRKDQADKMNVIADGNEEQDAERKKSKCLSTSLFRFLFKK